jgi:hypothetical protein
MTRPIAGVFVLAVCAALAGCGHRHLDDDRILYAYDWWLGPLIVLLGLACVPAGWQLRREGKAAFAYALMVAGPLAALALAPGAFLNKVEIDQEHFEVRHGFWWAPTVHSVRFQDLTDIRLMEYQHQGTRGKHYTHQLEFTFRSGERGKISMDGDLRQEAGADILAMAGKHGLGRDENPARNPPAPQ